mgnify:CR=1 FL=1
MLRTSVLIVGVSLLVLLLPWDAGTQAQQQLTCEDALAKARAKIDLMVDVRDRADDAAAEALAVVRKQRDKAQQAVKTLQEQLAAIHKAPGTPTEEKP